MVCVAQLPRCPALAIDSRRLWGASTLVPEVAQYTRKKRISDEQCLSIHDLEHPAACSFLFEYPEVNQSSEEISITPVTALDSFIRLVEFSYNLDITDKAFLASQFEVIGQLIGGVGCYELTYTREFSGTA